MYVHAHSLPVLPDSLRFYDSQMILGSTFFTCNNLLFHKDEAEFHFIILGILQQMQLSEAGGSCLLFIHLAFFSFNTVINVHKLCNLISFHES